MSSPVQDWMDEKLKLGSQDWLPFHEVEPEVTPRSQVSVPQVTDQRGRAKDETNELIRSFREKHQRLLQQQPTFYVQGVQSRSNDSLPPYQRTSSPTPLQASPLPSPEQSSSKETTGEITSSGEPGVNWICNRPFVAVNEQIRQLYVTVAEQLSHHAKKSDKVRRLLKDDGAIKYILNKASTKIVQIEKFESDEDLANELITAVGKLASSFVSVCVVSHRSEDIIKLFDDGLHRLLRRTKVDPTISSVSSEVKTGQHTVSTTVSDIRLFNPSSQSSLSKFTSSLKESRDSKDWKASHTRKSKKGTKDKKSRKDKKTSSLSSISSSTNSSFSDLTLKDSSTSSTDRFYSKKKKVTDEFKKKRTTKGKKERKATPISKSIKSAQASRAIWSQALRSVREDKKGRKKSTPSSVFSSLTLSSSSSSVVDRRRSKDKTRTKGKKDKRSSGSSYLKSNSSVERQLFGGSDSFSDLSPVRVGFYQKNLPSHLFQPRTHKTTKAGIKNRTFH